MKDLYQFPDTNLFNQCRAYPTPHLLGKLRRRIPILERVFGRFGKDTIAGGIDSWKLATEVFSDNFQEASVFSERVEDCEPQMIVDRIGPINLLLASPECTNHRCARCGLP